jgi:hypothetical protein
MRLYSTNLDTTSWMLNFLSPKPLLASFRCWSSPQLHSTAGTEQPAIIKQKNFTPPAVFLSFDILVVLKCWFRWCFTYATTNHFLLQGTDITKNHIVKKRCITVVGEGRRLHSDENVKRNETNES